MPLVLFKRSLIGKSYYVFRTLIPPERPLILTCGDVIAVRITDQLELIARCSTPPVGITKLPVDINSLCIDVEQEYTPPLTLLTRPDLELLSKVVSVGALLLWLEYDSSSRRVRVATSLLAGQWGSGKPFWKVRPTGKLYLNSPRMMKLLDLLHVVPLLR